MTKPCLSNQTTNVNLYICLSCLIVWHNALVILFLINVGLHLQTDFLRSERLNVFHKYNVIKYFLHLLSSFLLRMCFTEGKLGVLSWTINYCPALLSCSLSRALSLVLSLVLYLFRSLSLWMSKFFKFSSLSSSFKFILLPLKPLPCWKLCVFHTLYLLGSEALTTSWPDLFKCTL